MIEATETDKAFAAGWFESCGFVMISKNGGRSNGPRVRVKMRLGRSYKSCEATVQWFVDRWGGTPQMHSKNTGSVYVWSVALGDARKFLTEVLPYLTRRQAMSRQVIQFFIRLEEYPLKMKPEQLAALYAIIDDINFQRKAILDAS